MALNIAELVGYAEWSLGRLKNNEDPRDLAAFAEHLKALGADYTDLRRYGVPILVTPAPTYTPTVIDYRPPKAAIQGTYATTPRGVILHGSRSGRRQSEIAEFESTATYCQRGAFVPDASGGYYLCWSATIGPDRVGIHTTPDTWGWNAGADSRLYLAVEFSQPTVVDPISDAQVNAFCWWFVEAGRRRWPNLPTSFVLHAETEQGRKAGKTDAFPAGSTAGEDLKARIVARLTEMRVR